jgi:hypothetical protein
MWLLRRLRSNNDEHTEEDQNEAEVEDEEEPLPETDTPIPDPGPDPDGVWRCDEGHENGPGVEICPLCPSKA